MSTIKQLSQPAHVVYDKLIYSSHKCPWGAIYLHVHQAKAFNVYRYVTYTAVTALKHNGEFKEPISTHHNIAVRDNYGLGGEQNWSEYYHLPWQISRYKLAIAEIRSLG